MAFFDPVDPSTESLLWPGRVGFCIVADAAATPQLPLRVPGQSKGTRAAESAGPLKLVRRRRSDNENHA